MLQRRSGPECSMSDETRVAFDEPEAPVSQTVPPPVPGAVPLGSGGMGAVFRVHDPDLDRPIALKVLHSHRALDATSRARFLAEARLTARLDHPGVVPIHAVGTLPDGRPWFTMKEVRGRTLTEVAPTLDLRRHIDILRRVSEAVAAAHAQQVVHRDLKPDNVMVGAFGEVLVLDWGIAVQAGAQVPVAGTPGYVAPEVLDGAPPTPRSDVFALGCMLWGIGRADAALVDLARACRSPAPEHRPADAAEVAEALRRWQEGADRRERALALVDQAGGLLEAAAQARKQAAQLAHNATETGQQLGPGAPLDKKRALWAMEDAARDARQAATDHELAAEGILQAALAAAPDDPEVHLLLALHHFGRVEAADAVGDRDRETARVARHLVHVPETEARAERPRQWLAGTGLLSVSGPAGHTATLSRYTEVDRVLVPEAVDTFELPLVACTLKKGRYRIDVANHPSVFVAPVRPLEHTEVVVDSPGEAIPNDCARIPAGWFRAGGDPDAPGATPVMDLWLDAFVIQKQPVCNADYLAFLNHLHTTGHPHDARRFAPKMGVDREPLWTVGSTGLWEMRPDEEGDAWPPHWAIAAVDFDCAQAYAAWLADQTGLSWRLPTEWEWEKAARGPDGRPFPWGDHFDRDFCCNKLGQGDYPFPAAPDACPADTSVYGVRHVAGNFHDWCATVWSPTPHIRSGDRPTYSPIPHNAETVMIRGGSWHGAPTHTRLAARQSLVRRNRSTLVSFRLVRPL